MQTSTNKKYNPTELRQELETYIHGIEIDSVECEKCIKNVTAIAMQYGIENVHWDIQCENTLTVKRFNGKMDFVVGNPPYVRVHNLDESLDLTKTFSFAQDGMTDLYIVFYEIGLKMLNEKGVLGYITPSSYFNSLAGSYMRKIFVSENLVDIIVDLKHFQAFNATTYTEITILKKDRTNKTIEYYQFDEKNHIPCYVETLSSDDFYISGNFYFATKKDLDLLKKVFFNLGHCDVEVKNGYATLCDSVFIGNFVFSSDYVCSTRMTNLHDVLSNFYIILLRLHIDMLTKIWQNLRTDFLLLMDNIPNRQEVYLLQDGKIKNGLLNVTTKYYKCVSDNFVYAENLLQEENVNKFYLDISFLYYKERNVLYLGKPNN